MTLSLSQRFNNGIQAAVRATTSVAPFIGDSRYTDFHGINLRESAVRTPMGRIEIARRSVWVYACTISRVDAIKYIPLKLYKSASGGRRIEYLDHPAQRVIDDVNPYGDTPIILRAATEQGICIHGRYQWKKVRNRVGIIKELHRLPSHLCKPIARGQIIDHWVFEDYNNGQKIKEIYAPDDIVPFRCLDFDEGVEGLGFLQVAVETTIADINITVTQNAMSKNAARPSAIMTTLNKLNDSDYERENARIQMQYAGAVNAGKIILIDNAQDTKFQTVQLSPSEMQWIQEHESHIKDICAASRVPPGIAGDYGEASRIANLGGMHRAFAEICVRPELSMIEDVVNSELLWKEDWGRGVGWERDNGLFFAHDLSGVAMFREDETARTNRAKIASTSGAKWDEAREMHGLDPVGGKLGDTSFVPANLVPVTALLNAGAEDEEGSTDGSVGLSQTIASAGNPPNESEARETTEASEAVKALKLIEQRQYKKWKKKPHGEFKPKYLNNRELRSLDDEIRDTLKRVEDAIKV